jgi:hypothetical protein
MLLVEKEVTERMLDRRKGRNVNEGQLGYQQRKKMEVGGMMRRSRKMRCQGKRPSRE